MKLLLDELWAKLVQNFEWCYIKTWLKIEWSSLRNIEGTRGVMVWSGHGSSLTAWSCKLESEEGNMDGQRRRCDWHAESRASTVCSAEILQNHINVSWLKIFTIYFRNAYSLSADFANKSFYKKLPASIRCQCTIFSVWKAWWILLMSNSSIRQLSNGIT